MEINDIGLNEVQKKIVTHTEGPTLVIAGAGTGKTRVLTSRIAYIVDNLGFDPNRILAITFTNKAANEMKTRVCRYLGNHAFPWINTFHSFCLKFLREEIHLINYQNNFTIIDDVEQKNILSDIYRSNEFKKEVSSIKSTLYYIDACKSINESIETYLDLIKSRDNITIPQCELIKKTFYKYREYLKINNILDFNDLLNFTYKIFTMHQDVKAKWAKNFDYILIDEFQDTNSIQYEIACMLTTFHQNIFVVGDPDQSIYSWRGADREIIKKFESDFNNITTFVLDQNYRSTQEILNVANDIIKANNNEHSKKLFSIDKHGPIVKYYLGSSQDIESIWICKRIKDLIAKGIAYDKITILFRSNFWSRNIEQALIQAKIPYYIFGGYKFYQRKEIKDIISYLKVVSTKDETSLKRIINSPSRKVSDNSISLIEKYATEKNMKFYDALEYVEDIKIFKPAIAETKKLFNTFQKIINKENTSIENLTNEIIKETAYMDQYNSKEDADRFQNIQELINSIRAYESNNPKATLSDYLQDIQLFTVTDEKSKRNCVQLMTIHMSKGLEFNCVFITGLIENIFPSYKSISDAGTEAIEEERRIMYVATTRARHELYLSASLGRNFDNSSRIPSRFIAEISKDNLNITGSEFVPISRKKSDNWFDSKKTVNYSENIYEKTPDFIVGEIIQHKYFGEGVIIEIKNRTIVVAFDVTIGTKEIVSNHKAIVRKMK